MSSHSLSFVVRIRFSFGCRFVLLTPSPSKQGHPELLARRRASSPGPSASGLQRSSVLLHRPPAGQPGGHSTAHRGESPTGVPRSAALLQRYLESVSSLQPTVKTGYYTTKMATNGGKSVQRITMIRYEVKVTRGNF